jgi:cellulose synthase/poly-beta-1,6-N-acetylglucosamine synthase-like glycosyltransferase
MDRSWTAGGPDAPLARRPRPARFARAGASGPAGRRLGEILREAGDVSQADVHAALAEQDASGGRLGEILTARGTVAARAVTDALARQLGVGVVQDGDAPLPLLPADTARRLRVVALEDAGARGTAHPVPVAIGDPTPSALQRVSGLLGRPVEPRLADDATLDALLMRAYAQDDAADAVRMLRDEAPDLSAFRTALSRPQGIWLAALGVPLLLGLAVAPALTGIVLAGAATGFFFASTGARFYAALAGWAAGATVAPSADAIAAMDERDLPTYTVLLPLYKEKPSTLATLFAALSRMDYPKHRFDGLLLIEADDGRTREAINEVGRPAWARVIEIPPGMPKTKPRAMAFGLRYAKGAYVAVYDAEDKPDPDQIKKAVWGFARADSSVACLQAKLAYYNPRQNLLTRWFTLEYDAWFNLFLPGLHHIGAPIPLGGTSNHFRRSSLDWCLGWDPYNVTEDADLGLRFARLGLKTAMLESVTGEEANSQVMNWLRQRSRWSKGYMQTLLVHTRRPRALVRQLGPRGAIAFLFTMGSTVLTALLAPVFWALLSLWVAGQPGWIAELFPGAVYYLASLSLLFGNFFIVFLSLCAAVGRGHDDLAPYTLLMPAYWVLMSVATYMALVELFVRPHHWHKTEHALHLVQEGT